MSGPQQRGDPIILVVDDEESDRVSLAAILESAGYVVLTATSGREALSSFLREPLSAVVTDVVMADVDGVSLISWLRSLKPDLRIIAISGKGGAGLAAAKAVGAVTTLTKPVDGDELLRAVDEAVNDGRGSEPSP